MCKTSNLLFQNNPHIINSKGPFLCVSKLRLGRKFQQFTYFLEIIALFSQNNHVFLNKITTFRQLVGGFLRCIISGTGSRKSKGTLCSSNCNKEYACRLFLGEEFFEQKNHKKVREKNFPNSKEKTDEIITSNRYLKFCVSLFGVSLSEWICFPRTLSDEGFPFK